MLAAMHIQRPLAVLAATFLASHLATAQVLNELESLLAALKIAPTEQAAGDLERRIRDQWLKAGTPATTVLLRRSMRDLSNHDVDEALTDIESALMLEPDLTEAFYRRAVVKFEAGNYNDALADLQETLHREPRHFLALQTLSRIAEARQDWKGALAAFKRVLEIDPKTPGGSERLSMLEQKVKGTSL